MSSNSDIQNFIDTEASVSHIMQTLCETEDPAIIQLIDLSMNSVCYWSGIVCAVVKHLHTENKKLKSELLTCQQQLKKTLM